MDKNKTIVVIISIALVVVVACIVILWFLYPHSPTANPNTANATTQYALGVTNPTPDPNAATSTVAATSPTPSSNPSVITQQVLIVGGSNTDPQVGSDGSLIVSTPKPSPTATPSLTPGTGLVVAGASPAATVKPQASTAPVKTAKPSATKLPAAAPQTAPARHGNVVYWIQVISSPNKDRVEQIKTMIGGYGFKGLMSQFNKNGTDFYRLRYGPYYDKDEATKFLDWVKVIKGFESSYIVPDKLRPAK